MTQYRVWEYQPSSNTLELNQVERPTLGENQILVANKAIGINPVDWKFIHANPLNWEEGHVPGVDGAGEIIQVGANVDPKLVGRRVAYHAALKRHGSFAEMTPLYPERVMMIPDGMSFELAAALPCPMLTAWQAFEKIPHNSNRRVLIAGLGAVNKILCQILVAAGFQVDALSASLSSEQAQLMGIHHVYRTQSELPHGYMAIFDAAGEQSAASLVPLLKANGHIISILGRISIPIDPAFTRTISYHEIALGALHDFGDNEDWQTLMQNGETLMTNIVSDQLKVEEPVSFAFEQMPQALKHSEESKQKTVVSLPATLKC
ncbi:alcohol dehydrogenase catalytic domain-containing protein [Vibrio taketomensis]|uniref:alcohol dehydrogenase catalytic domain-containing protein n=1 Tax=Vibrio taketomensis TaxID=2572923 RepID=UPI0013894091|nr:alcohol dehydrogenase catalytic domain-containing protein [Vibrio taketomensis]